MRLILSALLAVLLFPPAPAGAQQTDSPAAAATAEAAPLPDVAALMKAVEANQKSIEDAQKDYLYKQSIRFERLNSHGDVKKTESRVDEVFWINNVQLSRRLENDGKPLTPDEAKKENERIDKEAVKLREKREKAAAEGKQTDSRGNVIEPLSRYLELVTLTNPRREMFNGRPTIVLDFTGDENAKSNDAAEKFVKQLAGTLWVDEQDKVVARFDGHFLHPFKLGGGLLVNISQGTHFSFLSHKVNDEVWLPDSVTGNGHVRVLLLLATEGDFALQTSDYRKFKTTSTVLPTFTPVPEEPAPK